MPVNVLLAEDTRNSNNLIRDELANRSDVNLLPIAADGFIFLEYIQKYRVHLVLLDLLLPGTDGITVLRKLREMNLPDMPMIILCTALATDNLIQEAVSLGASHCLLKPADPVFIVESALRAYDSYHNNKKNNPFTVRDSTINYNIYNVLRELNMPPNLLGYQYLKTGIQAAVKQHGLINNVTTQLYPMLAHKFDTTPKRVERVIRHAIEKTWDRADISILHEYFGYSIDVDRGRPTNSEFIARIADIVIIRGS